MRYFLDTEFDEDGRTIELISVGIVAEDGRGYYAINQEMDFERVLANPWLVENVVPDLPIKDWARLYHPAWKTRAQMRKEIIEFVGKDPEFWGYYADYDWVALCQLYGRMIDLPKRWPMYCRDLKQLSDELKIYWLPEQGIEHHALEDARWAKLAWDFLTEEATH